jgi:hypothetical protein
VSRGLLIAMLFALALGVPRDTSADAATTSLCAALPRVAENVASPSSDVVPLVARDDAIRTALRFARSSDVALCSIRLSLHDSFLQENPLVWVVEVDAANLEPLGGPLNGPTYPTVVRRATIFVSATTPSVIVGWGGRPIRRP